MAKARRQPRHSAPIPEDLPPFFAPQNGRVTRQTVKSAEERLASEKRTRELASVYQIKQELFRTLVDQRQTVVPPRADAFTAEGTPALIDLPTNPYDLVHVPPLPDGQPNQINIVGGNEPIGMYSHRANTVLVPEQVATPMIHGTHTFGRAMDLPARARLQQSVNALNNQLTALGEATTFQVIPPTTAASNNFLITAGTTNTVTIPIVTTIPTNNGTVFTGYTQSATAGGIAASWIIQAAGATMTNQHYIWTGQDDDWGCYAPTKHKCKDDWTPAWSRRHKRMEQMANAVAYIEQLTDQQRVWKQWSTVLHTSKESRAQQEARQREAQRVEAARQERARVDQMLYAERQGRAEKLLKAVLNPAQREEYERNQYFDVRGQSGNKYRIKAGSQHGNVYLLNERNQEMVSYCIQPVGNLPNADAHVAQKLMLETDEAAFLRIANATTLRRAA